MTIYSFRASLCGVGLLVLASCASNATAAANFSPAAVDLGASDRVPSTRVTADADQVARQAGQHPVPVGIQLVHDRNADAHAVGVVNGVDTAQRKINVTHEPIPAIGWPSMTMDFPVAPSVDLTAVKPGARVDFTIEKGKGGMYEIQSVQPTGARR